MCLFISHQKEQLQNWFFYAKFKLDGQVAYKDVLTGYETAST